MKNRLNCNLSMIGSNLTRYILVLIKLNMFFLINQQFHTTHTYLIFKKKKSTQPKIGQNFINVNKNPSIYIILNSQNLLERLSMHTFLNKYVQKKKNFTKFLNKHAKSKNS